MVNHTIWCEMTLQLLHRSMWGSNIDKPVQKAKQHWHLPPAHTHPLLTPTPCSHLPPAHTHPLLTPTPCSHLPPTPYPPTPCSHLPPVRRPSSVVRMSLPPWVPDGDTRCSARGLQSPGSLSKAVRGCCSDGRSRGWRLPLRIPVALSAVKSFTNCFVIHKYTGMT